MEYDDEPQNNYEEGDNLENILDDLGLGQENNLPQMSKKDSTIFVIDCSKQINVPLEGDAQSQLEIIFEGYSNFLQRKIIANAGDEAGLILYNVNNQSSSNFKNIFVVHKLGVPSATSIKEANNMHKMFDTLTGGISQVRTPMQHVFWTYSDEIKKMSDAKYHLRLFLFTDQDNPHPVGTEERAQAINQAKMLSEKNVQIQLFPLRKHKRSLFNVTKFYQEVITFDPDQINETVLDSSSKILDLKERLRQKEFKKRTLNRLLMKIGNETEVGVKLYALYTKAKRPVPKKLDARTNKSLQRVVKKLNKDGNTMFEAQIGTYYPLGGEKVKFTKEDMMKVKNIEPPGMTLIGFKPRKFIKPYHNLRTSYFLYPDEEHVTGSSQFCDGLINQLVQKQLVGIVKIVPRNNQQMSFAAILPQKQSYDEETHYQTPPGFNMIILPYADDIVNFVGEKTVCKPVQISEELVAVTSLLVNSLTINDFDFTTFENPSLQKFYSHLQAVALGEKDVEPRPDLLLPDKQGLENFKQIVDLLLDTVKNDTEYFAKKEEYDAIELEPKVKKEEAEDYYDDVREVEKKSKVRREPKKKVKEEEIDLEADEEIKLKPKRANGKNGATKAAKSSQSSAIDIDSGEGDIVQTVESVISSGNIDDLKVADLKAYLKLNGLSDKGKRDELLNRVLVFISEQSSI